MVDLELPQFLLLIGAGLIAGCINTIVGSGSLVSFPALLAVGFPPVLANVTNNVGVLPGSVSGAIGYRRELKGKGRSLLPLAVTAGLGGIGGALLLLVLPAEIFSGIVPALIALACVLVLVGPALKKRAAARKALREDDGDEDEGEVTPGLLTTTAATGIYGGYFGAAQGVILLSILSILLKGTMQYANGVKNVLAASANFSAAIVFVALVPIDWLAAAAVAVGAIVGGQVGAQVGRRIPDLALRIVIVAVGVAAIIALTAG